MRGMECKGKQWQGGRAIWKRRRKLRRKGKGSKGKQRKAKESKGKEHKGTFKNRKKDMNKETEEGNEE